MRPEDRRMKKYLDRCVVKDGFTVAPDCEHAILFAAIDSRSVPILYSEDREFLEAVIVLASNGPDVSNLLECVENQRCAIQDLQSETNSLRQSILKMGDWEKRFQEEEAKWRKIDRDRLQYIKNLDEIIAKMSRDAHDYRVRILELEEKLAAMQAVFDLNGIMTVVETSSV